MEWPGPRVDSTIGYLYSGYASELIPKHRTFGTGGKNYPFHVQNGRQFQPMRACKWQPSVGAAIFQANQSSLFNCKWLPTIWATIFLGT